MANPKVDEVFDGVNCSFSRNGATFTRKWNVVSDHKLTHAIAASWAGVSIGDRYEVSQDEQWNSYCADVSAECKDTHGKVWLVSAQYAPLDTQDQAEADDPTLELPKPQFGFTEVETIITHDANGDLIVNTAGVPFNPPLKDRVSLPTVNITRIERSYSLAVAAFYKDSVNADMFYDCEPGTVKLQKITATREWFSNYLNMDGSRGSYLFRVSYEFVIKPEGWKRRIISTGMQEIRNDKLVPITKNGVQVDAPVPLDENGQRIPPGSTAFYEMEIDTNKYMSFQALNLELPFIV